MLWRGDWRDESGTAQPGLSDSQWTEERHAEKSEALIRLNFFLSEFILITDTSGIFQKSL